MNIEKIIKCFLSSFVDSKESKLYPDGHFYSPIPSLDEIKTNKDKIFLKDKILHAIDLNEKGQVDLLNKFFHYYNDLPFKSKKENNLRYYYENEFFSYSDAIILYSMMRHLKPKKIVEIGSGFSTCLMLDVNELFLKDETKIECIEPFPQILNSLLNDLDKNKFTLREENLQKINTDLFKSLDKGDILFVDSTHVSKVGSDVNYIIHEILPQLNNGVYVHFHDIFYPFEYPEKWIFEGRAWNEAYMLRAFLEYNKFFKITCFNSFISYKYSDLLKKLLPLCLRNGGGSIWLNKVAKF